MANALYDMGPLAGVASVAPGTHPETNEDAAMAVNAARGGLCAVVVADGLTGYAQAGRAARFAAFEAGAWLRDEREPFEHDTFRRLFADVHAGLAWHGRAAARGAHPEPEEFGTTLLVAVDCSTELTAAYAGTGTIWHIRGNMLGLPQSHAMNLLTPRGAATGGRERLCDILDASAPAPVPSVVSVRKDPCFGDILLLCTGGIHSGGQLARGTRARSHPCPEMEGGPTAVYRVLQNLFARWDGEEEPPLQAALQACLEDLREREMLDDDATIGVIVTADALRNQKRRAALRATLATA